MAIVSFLLKEPKVDRPTPIFAFLAFDGKRVKIYSGLSIHPKQWLKSEQRAQVRGYAKNGPVNDALTLLEKRLLDSYAQHRSQGVLPTVETLRALAEPEEAPLAAAKKMDFWEYHDEWVALTQAKGKRRTAQTYITTAKHLRGFEQVAGYAVDFDTITVGFGDKFTAYLLNTAGLTDNTINKVLDTLKRFLRFATDRGYNTNQAFVRLNWKRQETDIMTLTAEEVTALAELDLRKRPYLENARNLFLLACYTGLRYSDLVTIKPEHIRGNNLRLITQKTREAVSIPLQTPALVIVQQYLAGEVHSITNQRLNIYLKELGQLAQIITPIEMTRYRGGERLCYSIAKWEKIGCHTGRRTFVTLSLERGLRPEVVMKITGHRDWKSFKRYVNITETAIEKEFSRVYDMPELLKIA